MTSIYSVNMKFILFILWMDKCCQHWQKCFEWAKLWILIKYFFFSLQIYAANADEASGGKCWHWLTEWRGFFLLPMLTSDDQLGRGGSEPSHFSCHNLWTATYHLLLTTYPLPLSTFPLPFTTYHLQLTTYNLPHTTYHLPLTTYHLPLTTLDHPSSI